MSRLIINADDKRGIINKNIYGHFAEHLGRCIYDGFYVGKNSGIKNTGGIRDDLVQVLKEVKIPVLRWPGGCFADDYHWLNGIGPLKRRPKTINTHWGGVIESNQFGTHEFFELCALLEAEPYICGNLGSGSVQEMRDWIEYMTFGGESSLANLRRENGRQEPWSLKYFGVGNENWGCGGRMRPEYYADLYRRYSCFINNFSDNRIYKIACGPNNDDYNWTEVLMREAGDFMNGLSLHYYTSFWENKAYQTSATGFGEQEWFELMKRAWRIEELVTKHSTVMDRYDAEKKVGLIVDEWGTWHTAEPGTKPGFLYQQNTLRDALVAGIHLNTFNNHCARVQMANIAQTINVLQAMVLTEGERMVLTPTYHVFNLYKVHQEATLLPVVYEQQVYCYGEEGIPQLSFSASQDEEGRIHLSCCNISPADSAGLTCEIRGIDFSRVKGTLLTAGEMDAHNTFDHPEVVKPVIFDKAKIEGNHISVTLPPMSIVVLAVD